MSGFPEGEAQKINTNEKPTRVEQYKDKMLGVERGYKQGIEATRLEMARQQVSGMMEGLRMAMGVFNRALGEPEIPTGITVDENDFRNTKVEGMIPVSEADRLKAERYARETGSMGFRNETVNTEEKVNNTVSYQEKMMNLGPANEAVNTEERPSQNQTYSDKTS